MQEAELVELPNSAWKLGEDAATWEPPRVHTFDGSQGGGVPGPTAKIKDHINVRRQPDAIKRLADLFMFFFPLTLLTFVANESNRHAFEDWVVEKEVTDLQGQVKKKKMLVPCKSNEPNARHRATKGEGGTWEFTPGFVLAWLGVCIIFGGHSIR